MVGQLPESQSSSSLAKSHWLILLWTSGILLKQ